MKQIKVTPDILPKLQAAAGEGVDVSEFPVFEAIALNTLPVRKEHPLFKGGQHSVKFLSQMNAAVNKESLPLQIVHDSSQLPSGRVFHSAVVQSQTGPELRTLFWVDPKNSDLIASLNNGTIDQVSVSILTGDAICSECGWDFLGSDASFENIYSGLCANDHQMGDAPGGPHVVMNDLDQWFEMSLVGRGGATGARIVPPKQSALTNRFSATDGKTTAWLTLQLSSKDLEPEMDLKELKTTLDGLTTSVAALTTKMAAAPDPAAAEAVANTAALTDLTTRLKAMEDAVKEQTTQVAAADAAANAAGNFLLTGLGADWAKKILIMSGDVEAKLPEDPKAALDLITSKLELIQKGSATGKTTEAASGSGNDKLGASKGSAAFKSARS